MLVQPSRRGARAVRKSAAQRIINPTREGSEKALPKTSTKLSSKPRKPPTSQGILQNKVPDRSSISVYPPIFSHPNDMADQEELRQLKIKTGSVKRLTKELAMYEKEHAKEKARVGKMKEDNADASDIKQAVRVLLRGSR